MSNFLIVFSMQGKLVQFDSYHKRHKVIYDDGEEEWVALTRESFRYLTPRARSAGCNTPFRQAMAQLGADQEVGGSARRGGHAAALQGTISPVGPNADKPPELPDAANWQISLQGAGDGRWHRGEVLCYDVQRKRHLVMYDDGEDEWVDLSEEEVVWHGPVPEGRKGLFPGRAPDVEEPSGTNAIGWRLAVFWPGDAAFYSGEVTSFDEATGRHEVSYDDGEEGTVHLSEDKIKWILPPGVAVDHENLERLEVGGGRPRRRVTANGGESDPDYEFEQQAAGQSGAGQRVPRRGMYAANRPRAGKAMQGGAGASWEQPGQWDEPLWQQSPFQRAAPQTFLPAGLQGPGEAGGPEAFDVAPSVVRHITRVPSFANLGGEEARLGTTVTVRIYLSGSSASSDGSGEAPAAGTACAKGGAAAEKEGSPASVPAPCALQADTPKNRLQARLEMLDLMARRVGRAQQAIVKGVPTDLPTQVVRPLRVGPAAVRTISPLGGSGRPQQLQPAGPHRLSRPPGVAPSSFVRRRNLDEESSEESDGQEDREDAEDSEGHSGDEGSDNGEEALGQSEGEDEEEGEEGPNGRQPMSSSGSSDDEGSGGDGDEPMVSPRSPSFPRGGKVKPNFGGGELPGSPTANLGQPQGPAPSPVVPPAGDARTPSDDANNAAHCIVGPGASGDMSIGAFSTGVDLHACDSVANLLAMPRTGSMLLADMPSAADGPGGAEFMGLEA